MRGLIERAFHGDDLDAAEVCALLGLRGGALDELAAAADALRREQVGDVVTYVVNRNINFTNVCVMACRFCAFSRDLRSASEAGYLLPVDEIVRRAVQARDLGATEVCVQAGLIPDAGGRHYVRLVRAIKEAAPELHVHGCSPEEVRYGARLAGRSVRDHLAELRDAGLGSLPGTSAEILDDAVRERISPGRIPTAAWVDVIRTAHALGLPTTSTIMYGHVETRDQVARHLLLLRDIQRAAPGGARITELVPLSFVHEEAPLFRGQMAGDGHGGLVSPGPTEGLVLALYATARLVLGRDIGNLQASWVKEGLPLAARLLAAGANDLGGTLMNESISTSAGASFGQLMRPARLRAAIASVPGRIPRERTTLYALRPEPAPGPDPAAGPRPHPLDLLDDDAAATLLGSYDALVRDPRFRYRHEAVRAGAPPA